MIMNCKRQTKEHVQIKGPAAGYVHVRRHSKEINATGNERAQMQITNARNIADGENTGNAEKGEKTIIKKRTKKEK